MGKFKTGGIVDDIRGVLGGIRFTRNATGKVFMAATSRPHQQDRTWIKRAAGFATVTNAYKNTLTDANRLAWEMAARFIIVHDNIGRTHTMPGRNYFIATNTKLTTIGSALNLVPPATTSVSGVSNVTASATAPGTITVVITPTMLGVNEKYWIAANGPRPLGAQKVPESARLIAAEPASALPINLATVWLINYGPLVANTAIWIQVRVINTVTGITSPYFPARTIVT